MNKAVKIGLIAALGTTAGVMGLMGYNAFYDAGPSIEVVYNFPLASQTGDVRVSIPLKEGSSGYDAFIQVAESEELVLNVEWFDFDDEPGAESAMIQDVNEFKTLDDWSQWWQFSVNNEIAPSGVSGYGLQEGDVISLDYNDGMELDALEWLVDNQNESNGALGDTFFEHSFGLLGLSLYDGPEVDKATERAVRYTLRAQKGDASFRSDDLYTAVATMSLLANGLTVEDFAKGDITSVDLLLSHQRDIDGGWMSGSNESDVSTTSWVMMAIAQAGYTVPETAVEYLLDAQDKESGAWGYRTGETSSLDYTQEAVLALAAADYPRDQRIEKALAWLSDAQDAEGCYTDGFHTALGALVADAWNGNLDAALACFSSYSLNLQKGDGSFGRTSNPSNAMDTGLSLWALQQD